jgi:hypothetical protein
LTKKDTFGDIALNQSSGRTATIIVDQPACFLKLTAEDYHDALKSILQREKNEKIMSVIRSIPSLERLIHSDNLEKIVYSIKVQRAHSGNSFQLRRGNPA